MFRTSSTSLYGRTVTSYECLVLKVKLACSHVHISCTNLPIKVYSSFCRKNNYIWAFCKKLIWAKNLKSILSTKRWTEHCGFKVLPLHSCAHCVDSTLHGFLPIKIYDKQSSMDSSSCLICLPCISDLPWNWSSWTVKESCIRNEQARIQICSSSPEYHRRVSAIHLVHTSTTLEQCWCQALARTG